MARCTGGASPNGQQRSGRMHLNGDENDCAKHQSDNFSFMSTVSRVATRNQPLPQALFPVGEEYGSGEEGDVTETERAPSVPSTIPETVAGSQSLGSTSSHLDIARQPRSQSLASTTSQLTAVRQRSRSLPHDRENGIAIALDAREIEHRPSALFWIASVLLLTIVAYAYYRWFYRAEFRYQNELLRQLYGLERSKAFWI